VPRVAPPNVRWARQDLEESGILPALLASDDGECGPGKLPAEEVAAECAPPPPTTPPPLAPGPPPVLGRARRCWPGAAGGAPRRAAGRRRGEARMGLHIRGACAL